jgi:hypothetical protein
MLNNPNNKWLYIPLRLQCIFFSFFISLASWRQSTVCIAKTNSVFNAVRSLLNGEEHVKLQCTKRRWEKIAFTAVQYKNESCVYARVARGRHLGKRTLSNNKKFPFFFPTTRATVYMHIKILVRDRNDTNIFCITWSGWKFEGEKWIFKLK